MTEEASAAAHDQQQSDPAAIEQAQSEPIVLGFEVTLLIPSQSFLDLPRALERKLNSDNYLEIPLPSQLQDAVHDLKSIITESPEGFWLGQFGLKPIVSELIQAKEEQEGKEDQWGPWVDLKVPEEAPQDPTKAWRLSDEGVLGDYADVAAVFGDEGYEKKRRGLKVVPTPYTPLAMNTHLLRLRNVLFSDLTQLTSNATYDPTSFAIGAGQTIYRDVRGEVPDDVVAASAKAEESAEGEGKGKGKKAKQPINKAAAEINNPPESTAAPASAEHPFTNFKLDELRSSAFVDYLKPAASSSISKPCVKALGISPWSPPPHPRRLRGDLVYLTLTTLEGENLTITGATSGFWVSKSTASTFDPSPRSALPKGVRSGPYHSLIELVADLSPLFAKNLVPLIQSQQQLHGTSDIYATLAITHQSPPAPWIVAAPQHAADPFRTQLAYLLTTSTTAEQLPPARDWIDEFAQAKESPKSTMFERLYRERVAARTHADFASAATRGALSIARGDIPPLNPNEAPEAHTFVHNNMLFTKAEDATQLYSHMGGNEAARYAATKDVAGVRWLEKADIDNLNSMATVLVDHVGHRWIVQSLLPGLFKAREDEEPKIVDGQVENLTVYPNEDEKAKEEAKAALDKDLPFPNDATLNKEDYPSFGQFRIVYGSANPEVPDEKVRASAYFDALAEQVADKLRFARHTVRDATGKETKLWTSTDVHGIACPDGRSYFIDCFRLHCVDVEFLENDVNGPLFGEEAKDTPAYPHRLTLLRMELLENYHATKLRAWMEERVQEIRAKAEAKLKANGQAKSIESELKEASQDAASSSNEPEKAAEEATTSPVIDAEDFTLRFNPDAFVERKPAVEGEEAVVIFDAEEESTKAVRDASIYLREQAIPSFIHDVVSVGTVIVDGFYLTRLLHRKGINMRYLGHLADRIDKDATTVDFASAKKASKDDIEISLKKLKETVLHEMVIRAAKHLLNRQLRTAHEYDHASVISHFLNCLLGSNVQASPVAEVVELPIGAKVERSWTKLSPQSLRADLLKEIASRFRYSLSPSFFDSALVKNKVLRELSMRVGIQLAAREYPFEAAPSTEEKPATATSPEPTKPSKKKKNKNGVQANGDVAHEPLPMTVFRSEDLLNILPLVKATNYKSQLADDTFALGQHSLNENHIEAGMEQLAESLQLCEQVCGSVHSEASTKYHNLGILNHSLAQSVLRRIQYHELAESTLKEGKPDEEARARFEALLMPNIEAARAEHEGYIATAVRMIRQSIIICERTNGLDTGETIQQYSDLGLLEHATGNNQVAMRLTKHAILLWSLVYGTSHPSVFQLLTGAATMVQAESGSLAGVPLLEEALKLAEKLYGLESTNYASVQSLLAGAYVTGGDFVKALEHMEVARSIYAKILPADSKDLIEATAFVNFVSEQLNKAGEEQKAREERLKKKFPRLMTERQLAAQVRARQIVNGSSTSTMTEAPKPRAHGQKGNLSVDELVNFIQGGSLKTPRRRK